jgi:hypothetical protein
MSLLKEGVSTVRILPDLTLSIFTIIMPWRQEQEEEERKRMNKMKQTKDRNTQKSLLSWFGDKKGSSGSAQQASSREITKEEEKYQQ